MIWIFVTSVIYVVHLLRLIIDIHEHIATCITTACALTVNTFLNVCFLKITLLIYTLVKLSQCYNSLICK